MSLDRFSPFPLVTGVYFFPPSGSNFGVTPHPAGYLAFFALGYQEPLQLIFIPGPLPLPFPVAAGDIVSIVMSVNLSDTSTVNIYFSNGSFGTSFAASLPQGVEFPGQDASWTIEPVNLPGLLPQFGTVYFGGALAGETCDADGTLANVNFPDTSNTTVYTQPQYSVQVAGGEVVCMSPSSSTANGHSFVICAR